MLARGAKIPNPSRDSKNDGSDTLLKIAVPIHPREHCKKLEVPIVDKPLEKVYDRFVCAGGNGKSVCFADSGGPLVNQETREIIGISARVLRDASGVCDAAPALFTRVGSYIPWIRENLDRTLSADKLEDLLNSLFPSPTPGLS